MKKRKENRVLTWSTALLGITFPFGIYLILAGLYYGPYRRLSDPNKIFLITKRPRLLEWSLTCILRLGVLVFMVIFLVRFRILLFLLHGVMGAGHSWQFESWLLVGAFFIIFGSELLLVAHLLFYLNLCRDGVTRYFSRVIPPLPAELPKVVVLIPVCDELPQTLLRPLGSVHRIHYPNCRVILVENSRDPELKRGTLELARHHNVEVLETPNRGTKAAALNDVRGKLPADTRYLAVLDADQRVEADFVSDLVALLEANPSEGWVQTPQTYEDAPDSILRTAATQQIVGLCDGTLQGKDVRGVCPLLGTNFLLRLRALDEVGGWQEGYINEDTPTSYRMQLAGWKGRYQQHVYASGLAPPNFGALWKQQARWSLANTALFFSILGGFCARQRRSMRVVADYLAYVAYEPLTLLIAILALLPTAILVASFLLLSEGEVLGAPLGIWQWAFVSLYPFHILLIFYPQVNMGLRGYPGRNLILLQGLLTCLGPAYINGVRRAVFRGRAIFESSTRQATGGARADKSSFWKLSPALLAFTAFLAAGAVSLVMVNHFPASPFPWIVLFWSTYNAISTGHAGLFVLEEQRLRRAQFRSGSSSGRSSTPATRRASR